MAQVLFFDIFSKKDPHLNDFEDFYKFIFTKNVLQNYVPFQLLMIPLHQIILHNSERIFQKEYKNCSCKLMIKLEMRNYNIILTEKQRKYQRYHLEKLIKMNILEVKKYYLRNQIEEIKKQLYIYIFIYIGRQFHRCIGGQIDRQIDRQIDTGLNNQILQELLVKIFILVKNV